MIEMNNLAIFFQKHDGSIFVKILRKMYLLYVSTSNERRINYLRQLGANIGEDCIIRDIVTLGSEPYLVEIGDNTSFSGGVKISTHDGSIARLYYMGLTEKKYDSFGKVKIGKNCFIGMNSLILKNVTIGDNCIIGAGSVVTRSIPSNSVACGVPAKVVGSVSEFARKNNGFLVESVGMQSYEKRCFIENNMDYFENLRKEKEHKDEYEKCKL